MTATAKPALALRPFLPADVPQLAEIFRSSIMELTGEDYSPAQQEAWAASADDEEAFAARLAARLTLIGLIEGAPAGFAALEEPGHLDMLYVHPAAAGQGLGSLLIEALEKLATARGAIRLTADVSDAAEDLFRRRGFTPRQRNTVPIGQEWLANTTMEKQLVAKEPSR
jgi:putative acetyltransferase